MLQSAVRMDKSLGRALVISYRYHSTWFIYRVLLEAPRSGTFEPEQYVVIVAPIPVHFA